MGSRFFKNYAGYKITYPFGQREILGQSEHHAGVDLVALTDKGGALSDWVVAFDSGEVIEAGNHQTLLQKGGFYASLYQSQFT